MTAAVHTLRTIQTHGAGFTGDLWSLALWTAAGLVVAVCRYRTELTPGTSTNQTLDRRFSWT